MITYIEMSQDERKELFESTKNTDKICFLSEIGYYIFKNSLENENSLYVIFLDGCIDNVCEMDEIESLLKEYSNDGYEIEL